MSITKNYAKTKNQRKQSLLSCIPYFVLLCCILGSTERAQAQVTFKFDQESKSIELEENAKWKAGELLTVIINNYNDAAVYTYTVRYSSSDPVNTKGLTLFNRLNESSMTKLVGPEKILLKIPIDDKDYSHITITEYKGTTKTDEQVYTFRVRGGIKFDVSTGIFGSSLRDDIYVLDNDTDTTKRIVKENNGSFKVGTGVLAHLHSRWAAPLNLGISGGFEINNDAKVGYLAGFSIFLGYYQKFVISGGIAIGKKQVISNIYKGETTVDSSLTSVPMVSIWDNSSFYSLTYNF